MMKRKIILLFLLFGFFGFLPSSHMDIHLLSAPEPLRDNVENDPCFRNGFFCIYTQKDYLRFAGYVNRDYENGTFTLKCAKLFSDIDFTKEEGYGNLAEHPYIRPEIEYFKGSFNGNGHTITWDSRLAGPMFTLIGIGGQVINLHFKADALTFTSQDESPGFGMICMENKGKIIHCVTEGAMEISFCNAGGIAGTNYNTIDNCINRAKITVLGDGPLYAGGIAGKNSGIIAACTNEGAVRIQGSGRCYAGGIAGFNKSFHITYCTNQGEISVLGSGLCGSGGISGLNHSLIFSCANEGSITNHWQAGGIAGYNHDDIQSCKNTGDVSILYGEYQKDRNPKVRGTENGAGGICGYTDQGTIRSCYNLGEISVPDEDGQIAFGISRTKKKTAAIENSVCVKGTVLNFWRNEEIMMLDEPEMDLWISNQGHIPYQENDWQFDLEAAKKKLPLIPLDVEESSLTVHYDEVYLCDKFCLRCPVGFYIADISPNALCLKPRSANDTAYCPCEIWLLRLNLESMPYETIVNTLGLKNEAWFQAEVISNYNHGKSTADWLFLITYSDDFSEPHLLRRELLNNFHPLPRQISVWEGCTLSYIAEAYTGDKERYPELAARSQISDENRLYVGQELILPDEWFIYYHPPMEYPYFY